MFPWLKLLLFLCLDSLYLDAIVKLRYIPWASERSHPVYPVLSKRLCHSLFSTHIDHAHPPTPIRVMDYFCRIPDSTLAS